jgi:hypothetical protein
MVTTISSAMYIMLLFITLPNHAVYLLPFIALMMAAPMTTIAMIHPSVVVTASFYLMIITISVIGFYHRYTSEIHLRRAFLKYKAQYTLSEKLHMAQKQSEYLLGMILPRKIIDTLGKYGGNPSLRDKESMHDTFVELQGVTILFADIVGFTDFSGKVNTGTLISILSDIFAEFDVMASELDLEKIKTIGDCVEVCLKFLKI